MRACCLIRTQPDYRRDAFCEGLRACGYAVTTTPQRPTSPRDLLLIWNRYGSAHTLAEQYEAAGATVWIAENGYLGREYNGQIWYALSRNRHNGAGQYTLRPERWHQHGAITSPWRRDGDHVLVFGQRGIGVSPVASPNNWHRQAAKLIQGRPVVLREHPGERGSAPPLETQLENAWAVVAWSSGAALKAIMHGVPAFHGFDQWIGRHGARMFNGDVCNPYMGERDTLGQHLFSAMWRLDEICTGAPFR